MLPESNKRESSSSLSYYSQVNAERKTSKAPIFAIVRQPQGRQNTTDEVSLRLFLSIYEHSTQYFHINMNLRSSYINVPSGSNLPYSPVQNPCHISVIFVPVIISVYFCHFSPQKTKNTNIHHHRNRH